MMEIKLRSLVLTVFLTLCSLNIFAQVSADQRQALIDLYNSTNGAGWTNKTGWDVNNPNAVVTSWNAATQTGWYGVTVHNGNVIYISLNNNNLVGNLNNSLKNLKNLLTLSCSGNKITGAIPSGVFELQYLQYFNFNDNNLSGGISPLFGNLTNIIEIRLSNNVNLGGTIPTELGNLTKLDRLNFDNCSLSGSIPASIGQLINLTSLYVYNNNLTGPIPATLGNLKKLNIIWAHNNKLSETIPATLSGLKSVTSFNLQNNQLTGSIPSLVGMEKIIGIDLSVNQLTGSIPSEFGYLTTLQNLALQGNQLSGNIPASLGNLSELVGLSLSGNKLEGSIPTSFQSLAKLKRLYLWDNKLSGAIPNLSGLNNLSEFLFENNRFRFADFEAQYALYKQKMGTSFRYAPQAKTDVEETITKTIGSPVTLKMYTDNRFTQTETYQWYKQVGTGVAQPIALATDRTYTINNLSSNDQADYYCVARHPQITNASVSWQNLILTRNPIHLKVTNCVPISGAIRVLEPNTNVLCVSNRVYFIFETGVSNIANHKWTFYDTNGSTVLQTQTTGTNNIASFTYSSAGDYTVKVEVTDSNGCVTTFTKLINVRECNSCTINNPKSQIIKQLYINLLNHLLTKMITEGSIPNGYNPQELIDLAPYITDPNPRIYNAYFEGLSQNFGFSFADHGTDFQNIDVIFRDHNGVLVTDMDISVFTSPDEPTLYPTVYENNTTELKHKIHHINFCPVEEIQCVSHIAIVVDESGSIDETEARKIRKQLKSFIKQQADINDSENYNIHISLIGMSDNDADLRASEHIPATRVTNNSGVLGMFNQWIDAYRLRSGAGISPASDYWKSGLTVALNAPMKPNAVVMITDGCETANVNGLVNTMKKFSNYRDPANVSQSLTPNGPHLYVVGIEEGYYVNQNTVSPFSKVLPRNQDPNFVPELAISATMATGRVYSTAAVSLRNSLQFLLGYPTNQYPEADINHFTKDYYGHADFNLLASDARYFSDKLADGNYICGEAIDKNICDDCFSFQPEPGKEYVISAWVKEETKLQLKTYENPEIKIVYYNNKRAESSHIILTDTASPSGEIIDGWQRIVKRFRVPKSETAPLSSTVVIEFVLENKGGSMPVYFDDVRIHPLEGSMKAFVYDPETFKLMSELDENNYATFYEYDNEGGLVRVKKETEKGIKTIQETRSGNIIKIN
ncbi:MULTISPECIES: PKD domain-containing protein [unclassified Flavobacterium]|uniref:VWA domain-containing protein n=1 Tax=unclassified Flavobacterium TaxID=196869 RepID=UPI00086F03B8|nr:MULTISPECIES: PKD domain-containing protein [unclassified Flavobacterium]MBN9286253.1 VWA domain-containing protein [Flavobacterium sp.]ODS85036.1 MAG: hypothetical protein ABS44_15850 [Chryseobacterium sp. SCN 40-13]